MVYTSYCWNYHSCDLGLDVKGDLYFYGESSWYIFPCLGMGTYYSGYRRINSLVCMELDVNGCVGMTEIKFGEKV